MRAGESSTSSLHRKLITKVTQRIALVFLPPRVAAWRYQRGSRSLADNFASVHGGDGGGLSSADLATACTTVAAEEEEDDDEEADVPDELDELVDVLLTGLRDRDTGALIRHWYKAA